MRLLVRARDLFLRIPLWGRVVLLIAVVIGGFIAVVTPLFQNSGLASAEVTGAIPDHEPPGKFALQVNFDNTGDTIISPVCIKVEIQGPAQLDGAVFQGVDQVAPAAGRVCGGALTAQENIGEQILFHSTGAGPVSLTLTPLQGDVPVGKGLSGQLIITSR